MPSPRTLLFLVLALSLPAPVLAQWQGVIRTREFRFDPALFAEQTGEDPERVVEIPLADIVAAGLRPDAADFSYETSEATLKVKNQRMRTDLDDEMTGGVGGGYGIMHMDSARMYMVMPVQRMIIFIDVAQVEALMRDLPRPPAPPTPEIEPLNEQREINGVPCEGYRIRSNGELTVAWVSQSDSGLHGIYSSFAELVRKMNVGDTEPELLLASQGFPMLTYSITANGVQIEETLAIEPGTVPDSEFALPADFQRLSMIDMMQQQGR